VKKYKKERVLDHKPIGLIIIFGIKMIGATITFLETQYGKKVR